MKDIYLLFCLFPLFVFSQDLSTDYKIYPKPFGKIVYTNKKLATSSFEFCDTDRDGIVSVNIEELKNRVLDANPPQINVDSGVYIGTSSGEIQLVTNLTTNPTVKKICSINNLAITDIAYNQNGDMYVCSGYNIYKINKTDCTTDNVYTFNGIAINSLSFDRQSNIYFGGSDSKVYRLDNGNYNQSFLWNDFLGGRPAGDFVMFGDKMYIAWNNNGSCLLYEVTVNNNMNYVSHKVLGNLPNGTYGLASELGSLYGVTANQLFRIKINLNSIENEVILNNNNFLGGQWFGAAGKNEAVAFDVKAYETAADAQNQVNALPSNWNNTIPWGQTIYVVIKNTVNQQSNVVPVDIKIETAPLYTNPKNIEHCELDTNASIFDINHTVSEIIGSQTNLTVSFHKSEIDATNGSSPLPTLYTISGKYAKVYFRVTNPSTGCFSVSSFDLIINSSPVFTIPKDVSICDKFPLNFNFKAVESEIIGNQSNLKVTFYESDADALNNSNPLPEIYTFNSSPKPIYFRVTNVLTGCFLVSKFGFNLNLRTIFSNPKDLIICQSPNLNYKLDNFDPQIQEIRNGQNNNIAGFYNSYDDASNKINEITFPYNVKKKENEIFFRVENSSMASCFDVGSFFIYLRAENQNANIPFSVKISDWKSERNEIEILASGNYEYSIDGLIYQDIPVFKDLLPGEYQIFIRDRGSCSVISEKVFLMMYRNFFTPNGDGINDYWNVIASSGGANVKIMIYDRYGKFIKSLKGDSIGWDGNYNNNPMPSSDYWFEIVTEQGKILKGHFSLKR
ncbi:T9SS type B sorting domain-containing protein [Flavobacterium aquiphilum]|uniref:T9SS type B sorting domain-containing protein n=1 Tax=Flavobacterium aquiphilum TaxID=3003261 RepID=UPI002480CEAB|nr:T9SS type B sorting domain-containing protein [Flavobacterium aquiphilum]